MSTMEENEARYERALHAMQTGVAMEQQLDGAESAKHLRVGINSAMIGDAALAGLLIAKGVFTLEEYVEAQAKEAQAEVRRYENRLSQRMGTEVRLA